MFTRMLVLHHQWYEHEVTKGSGAARRSLEARPVRQNYNNYDDDDDDDDDDDALKSRDVAH